MKNLLNYLTMMVFAALTLTFTSCDDDEDPNFAAPTIVISPTTSSNLPGETVSVSVAITAEAGLASLKVNGTDVKTYTTEKTDAFSYDYAVPLTATVGSTVTLDFIVADNSNPAKTSSAKATITVGDPGKGTVTVQGVITANTTWSASKYYLLKGNVYVQSPAVLTIEAGTVILGDKVSKGALVINRGSKIHAVGTATSPIVFTSSAPKTFRNYGDWGGLVLLGKAVNNQSASQSIEGVTGTSGDDGRYGGTADDDNSGELQFVRIEFAGIALSTDNELNGLTLGSVGSGTTVDHIQVSYSGDDSYEWFGGKVNATHLIAYRGWDDDFDTDFGFTGNVQYAVSHRDPNIADKSGSNGFESDNDGSGSAASAKSPLTAPKFSNVSWFGPGVYARLSSGALNKSNFSPAYQFAGHLRRNTAIQIYNSIFIGSYLEGIHFDKTNPAAVFKGNYLGRIGVNVAFAAKKATAGNADGELDLSNFDADNFNTTSNLSTVDLSAVIAGMTATNLPVETPLSLLAPASSLLTGAKTVPAGLTQTTHIGAFDATTNWTSAAWVNFDPNATQY
ncbi:MAG: cell shape-determining protein MreB [Chryseolinea sp.]